MFTSFTPSLSIQCSVLVARPFTVSVLNFEFRYTDVWDLRVGVSII